MITYLAYYFALRDDQMCMFPRVLAPRLILTCHPMCFGMGIDMSADTCRRTMRVHVRMGMAMRIDMSARG